ncbi:MAG: hypothetical protein H6Q39_918 [Chloroflexi bacterium]|nr:hypothetical protein [Chloroflexota bacterium]
MAHGPATEWKKEKSEGFKTRLGLIMFAIYVPIYLGFVFYCVFDPQGVGHSGSGLQRDLFSKGKRGPDRWRG